MDIDQKIRFSVGILIAIFITSFGFPTGSNANVPEKIVSINLCTDEILLRLANPENIAAVTRYPKTNQAEKLLAEASNIKKIRGTLEEVLMLDPDLVVAGTFTHTATVQFLKKLGINVLVLDVPQSFEDIENNIIKMAEAIGEKDKGSAVARSMAEKIEKMKGIQKKKFKTIFLQSRGFAAGKETFENAIIEAAGGVNLAAEAGIRGHAQISLEELVTREPDIIIFSTDEKERTSLGRELLSHPAIKKGLPEARKTVIPDRLLTCGSPASVDAVEMLIQESGQQ